MIVTRITFVLMWLAVWLGTLVTGSGPHAGAEDAPRNALDGMLVTRLHTSVAYATIAASVICFALLRSRAALLLVLVEILQAGIGIAQYQLGLPIELVALHLLGASLAIATVTNLMLSVRRSDSKLQVKVSYHAVRRLPSQRRHCWIRASSSPRDPSTLTALPTSSLGMRRASVICGLQRPGPNWPSGSASQATAIRCCSSSNSTDASTCRTRMQLPLRGPKIITAPTRTVRSIPVTMLGSADSAASGMASAAYRVRWGRWCPSGSERCGFATLAAAKRSHCATSAASADGSRINSTDWATRPT